MYSTSRLRGESKITKSPQNQCLRAFLSPSKSNKCELYRPDGYNIGMNCGEAAEQTVMHFHCQVIPRYTGDLEDPKHVNDIDIERVEIL